jgi:NAD(P) transhydrogenase subunit alpha
VAATPETVKKLVAMGHTVVIEQGAGLKSAAPDSAYIAMGATIADSRQAALSLGDIVLKVRPAQADEIEEMKAGAVLISLMNPYANPHLAAMAAKKLSAFSMELLPRTTRAQSMDVLSSQNNIAGYKSVLLATQYYPHFMPMLMTAAGTVKPARLLILGVGVAGLQAIATAKRLGAVVEAFDVRSSTKEQVESLGAKFVEVPMTEEEKVANDGVYAKEMSEDYKRRQGELVDKHARQADIIITTALIPGRPAPRLLNAEIVLGMKPGSVIIDLAAENGGNCELTRPDEVVQTENGVTVVGTLNLPGLVAADASSLYARNPAKGCRSIWKTICWPRPC